MTSEHVTGALVLPCRDFCYGQDCHLFRECWPDKPVNNVVRFSGEYVKLHGQRKARLLDVMPMEIGENTPHTALVAYDTLRTDGSRYIGLCDGSYMLLIFLGDKGFMFTTIRRRTYEKMLYYEERIGQEFDVVIEERDDGNTHT